MSYTKPYIATIDLTGIPELTTDYEPAPQQGLYYNGISAPLPHWSIRGNVITDFKRHQHLDKTIYRRVMFHREWSFLIPQVLEHADRYAYENNMDKPLFSFTWLNQYNKGHISHVHRHYTEGDEIALVFYPKDHIVPLDVYDDDKPSLLVDSVETKKDRLVILSGKSWHATKANPVDDVRWCMTVNFTTEKAMREKKSEEIQNVILETNRLLGRI